MSSSGSPALWAAFAVVVVVMLALDLGIFRREVREITLREAGIRTAGWVGIAFAFNVGLYFMASPARALEFSAGYLLELALSVDNLFVFVVIFAAFRVPEAYRHRVLFWGIIGAVLLRGIFIAAGSVLVQKFAWIMYGFGALLLYTAWKLFRERNADGEEVNPEHNPALKLFRRFVPSVREFHGSHFIVKKDGKTFATPLLAVLVLVETSDVIFAVDSIPAIFGVTNDPFIIYTSNIFAILGLRSMYFLLAGIMHRFHYLKVGLAFILAFIGAKMMVHDFYKIPIVASLGVIAATLLLSVVASYIWPKAEPEVDEDAAEAARSTFVSLRPLPGIPAARSIPATDGAKPETVPSSEGEGESG
jgi:tellurite resistance protein TerC